MSNLLVSYLAVIDAARRSVHFEDFKTGGRLAGDIRNGYQARMSAFSELSRQGFVKLESGLLALGSLSPERWLTEALANGETESWEICDSFPLKARKFQPDLLNLEQIGRDGEDFVIHCLRQNLEPNLHSSIVHTSLTDDSAGYDIVAPNAKLQGRMLLEVKTSTRSGEGFTFHLSRNEWNTATRNPNWYVVLVRKVQGSYSLFGYLDSESLINYYPKDSHPDFQWSTVVGRLGADDLFVGLPGF